MSSLTEDETYIELVIRLEMYEAIKSDMNAAGYETKAIDESIKKLEKRKADIVMRRQADLTQLESQVEEIRRRFDINNARVDHTLDLIVEIPTPRPAWFTRVVNKINHWWYGYTWKK